MGEGGRTCRPSDRRRALEDEPYTVKCTDDEVRIELRGRRVRTLTGPDADQVRAAVAAGDETAVQELVARKMRLRGRTSRPDR